METHSQSVGCLLRLLDDPSPAVQKAVRGEIARLAPKLPAILAGLKEPLPLSDRRLLQGLMVEERQNWLMRVWPDWRDGAASPGAMEAGFNVVSRLLDATLAEDSLDHRLHDLAELARHRGADQDPMDLGRFLFQDLRYQGERTDHSNLRTASMASVLEEKSGLPVVLTWIFVLVGQRLGFTVRALPVNSHYLAWVERPRGSFLVDCGHRAASYRLEDVPADTRRRLEAARVSPDSRAEGVMARLLAHLVDGYRRLGRNRQAAFLEPFRLEVASRRQGPVLES